MDLSVFDTIEVKNVNRISGTDSEFCENAQKYFEISFNQILTWYNFFKDHQQKNPDRSHKVCSNSGKVYGGHMVNVTKFEGEYKGYEFSALFSIERCIKLLSRLCRSFEYDIQEYFNKTYNIKIETNQVLLLKHFSKNDRYVYTYLENGIPHYNDIVDIIVNELGGGSFEEKRRATDINDFNSSVHVYSGADLKGDTITFPTYSYFSHWGSYYINYENKNKIHIMLRAVKMFNDYPAHDIAPFLEKIENHEQWNTYYTIETTKTVGIKFCKNGNVSLKFANKDYAQLFYKMCRLKPKETR